MTKLEQAARQALGALEVATTPLAKDRQEVLRAITTLREALSGVQALSAAPAVPAGWKAVPVNPTPEMWKAAKTVPDPNPPYPPHYGLVWDAMLAASPTPPAEQAAPKAAPGVGNSGFDHKTAADFLSGKTVSDEAVRKFVAASRWAHDEKAALSAMLLSVRGVLASREAEIALLKKALLEAVAAPQQEAQEPAFVDVSLRTAIAKAVYQQVRVEFDYKLGSWTALDADEQQRIVDSIRGLYTAPQPAPAPLSDDVVKDAARWRMAALIGNEVMLHPDKRTHATAVKAYMDATHSGSDLTGAVDAAIAAQGGKV